MTEVRRRVKASQAQERRGAEQHGGRVQPGSGSMAHAKGDVRTPRGAGEVFESTLIEYKRTDAKSISFSVKVLEKIRREALLEGRRALLGFELGGRDYILIPADDYLTLEEKAGGHS